MRVLADLAELQSWRRDLGEARLGFIPTMGALHAGHRTLIERAREECDQVVVSIFVNPTQFNESGDFEAYPVETENDLEQCRMEGADAVFLPKRAMVYPDDFRYRVIENKASLKWEGTQRPGHFDGVLTVVMKLFQLVRPHRAYFGEKDWQQLQLVKGMCRAFFLDIDVVPCTTVRDENGLALSSRNARLSSEGRGRAALFPQILRSSPNAEDADQALRQAGFEVEYVADEDGRRLAAIQCEGVRLIDNIEL